MEVAHLYTKKRREFGHHCIFKDEPARLLESIPSTSDYDSEYILRNPSVTEVDTSCLMSEHEVNTERTIHKHQGMKHFQGGWPENVDGTDTDQVNRFLKKVNKEDKFKAKVKSLGAIVDMCVKQNNTIDIYEEYFEGSVVDHSSEPPSSKGLAVFRDPNAIKRTATNIDWHPEGNRIAVSYSVLTFQDERLMNQRLPVKSYIWDIANPNMPEVELVPASPLVCMRFNPKTPETIVGGSYNGLVSVFDLRKAGGQPVEKSVIENSHHDPVYDVYWTSSKTHNMCVSVSTDGQMLWWDTRRLGEPTSSLMLDSGSGTVLGGSSLEYNVEAGPTKYLVGTEQGIVLSVNLRKKSNDAITALDSGPGKHHGPVYSIQRNPTHNKFFMTVGDWTARIWSEDGKTPIMTTTYCKSYLTAGCWSPTRAGVFFTTRMDGSMDIWDYYYRQNAVALSQKVSDHALSSISVQGTTQGGGRLVAVGDVSGTVSLLEVCESLATPQSNEKMAISGMFERESKREKNLEKRAIEVSRRAKQVESDEKRTEGRKPDGKDERMEEILRKVDAEFLAMIKDAEEEESKGDDDADGGHK